MKEKYFLGLDIGTNSVGYAVTNLEYVLKRFHRNLMWGVSLFDEGQSSAERRVARAARRRADRKKQRISILQELMAEEIFKKDKNFFMRIKESHLLPEDSTSRKRKNIFFDDIEYTDRDYNNDFPTIHHLICSLMKNKRPHDIRLVYIACAYLLGHRGHFLIEVDKDNILDVMNFKKIYDEFEMWFSSMGIEIPFQCNVDDFAYVLKNNKSIKLRESAFKVLLFDGKKPVEPYEDYPLNVNSLLKLISGGKVKLSDLFKNESYVDLENNNISISSADFENILETLFNLLDDGQAELLLAVKKMNDWSLLTDIIKDCDTISEAKVKVYCEHQKDLSNLKKILKKYLPEKYNEVFRLPLKDKANYVNYSSNLKSVRNFSDTIKYCTNEDFCKYISGILKNLNVEDCDREIFDELIGKIENNNLCPKQVNTDNRVIPYQLYYYELKTILENASEYIDILNKKDEYGTVKDKILSIMTFRIPYYVGPLVSKNKSKFAWMERKEGKNGIKIYPWNFDEIVDFDKSENSFIRRMTCKCTYVAGEDVLPKNSLLYCKYSVFNEINNIKINGVKISVSAKQRIYEELFQKKVRVTVKMIKNLLISDGEMTKEDELSGVDTNIKSSLKSYHNFKNLINSGVVTENDVENIIERITVTTDKKRLKNWILSNYPMISEKDVIYISKLNYKDYGRLSSFFLNQIYNIDLSTGEIEEKSIISRMWETNDNLMQILSESNGYSAYIRNINDEYYNRNKLSLDEKLRQMYLSNSVIRPIMRTLEIAKEIKKIMKSSPEKIFIEMNRENNPNNKNKRTSSRKEQIKALFDSIRKDWNKDELASLEKRLDDLSDSDMRSEKYYLYFTQLGRCMYSGERLDFDLIGTEKYNIDHIYPQSKVKDDSLSNKVLVLSTINGIKKDDPIDISIKRKMSDFWRALHHKNLISKTKYERLMRSEPFTENELFGFINRQLVETSQAAKASANLLKEIFPESEIVYVKAGMVSEFRHEYDLLKCREINDLHHAKDAYLNIVVGNVHNVQFTKNPMNIIRKGETYTVNLKSLLKRHIERNGLCAWNPEKSFEIVRKMMSKNSVRYVRYSYCRKGKLFNINPIKAKAGLIPRKADLPAEKYGGYSDTTATFFVLVKQKEIGTVIIPIELLYANEFLSNNIFALEYCAKILSELSGKIVSPKDIEFPLDKRIIKVNSMLEIDGFRINIIHKLNKGRTLALSSAVPIIVDKNSYDYLKKLSSFLQKSDNGTKFEVNSYDKITVETNLNLFDLLCEKGISKPYDVILKKTMIKIKAGREKFIHLSVTEQVKALMSILAIFKTGRSSGCDLTYIGESKNAAIITLNSNLSKLKDKKEIYIIDQSPTGLFEKKSPNLLEL